MTGAGDAMNTETWAVCVNEWDGAEYHERIVGPFATEDEAETWALDCPDPTSVFDLMPPSEWRPSRG